MEFRSLPPACHCMVCTHLLPPAPFHYTVSRSTTCLTCAACLPGSGFCAYRSPRLPGCVTYLYSSAFTCFSTWVLLPVTATCLPHRLFSPACLRTVPAVCYTTDLPTCSTQYLPPPGFCRSPRVRSTCRSAACRVLPAYLRLLPHVLSTTWFCLPAAVLPHFCQLVLPYCVLYGLPPHLPYTFCCYCGLRSLVLDRHIPAGFSVRSAVGYAAPPAVPAGSRLGLHYARSLHCVCTATCLHGLPFNLTFYTPATFCTCRSAPAYTLHIPVYRSLFCRSTVSGTRTHHLHCTAGAWMQLLRTHYLPPHTPLLPFTFPTFYTCRSAPPAACLDTAATMDVYTCLPACHRIHTYTGFADTGCYHAVGIVRSLRLPGSSHILHAHRLRLVVRHTVLGSGPDARHACLPFYLHTAVTCCHRRRRARFRLPPFCCTHYRMVLPPATWLHCACLPLRFTPFVLVKTPDAYLLLPATGSAVPAFCGCVVSRHLRSAAVPPQCVLGTCHLYTTGPACCLRSPPAPPATTFCCLVRTTWVPACRSLPAYIPTPARMQLLYSAFTGLDTRAAHLPPSSPVTASPFLPTCCTVFTLLPFSTYGLHSTCVPALVLPAYLPFSFACRSLPFVLRSVLLPLPPHHHHHHSRSTGCLPATTCTCCTTTCTCVRSRLPCTACRTTPQTACIPFVRFFVSLDVSPPAYLPFTCRISFGSADFYRVAPAPPFLHRRRFPLPHAPTTVTPLPTPACTAVLATSCRSRYYTLPALPFHFVGYTSPADSVVTVLRCLHRCVYALPARTGFYVSPLPAIPASPTCSFTTMDYWIRLQFVSAVSPAYCRFTVTTAPATTAAIHCTVRFAFVLPAVPPRLPAIPALRYCSISIPLVFTASSFYQHTFCLRYCLPFSAFLRSAPAVSCLHATTVFRSGSPLPPQFCATCRPLQDYLYTCVLRSERSTWFCRFLQLRNLPPPFCRTPAPPPACLPFGFSFCSAPARFCRHCACMRSVRFTCTCCLPATYRRCACGSCLQFCRSRSPFCLGSPPTCYWICRSSRTYHTTGPAACLPHCLPAKHWFWIFCRTCGWFVLPFTALAAVSRKPGSPLRTASFTWVFAAAAPAGCAWIFLHHRRRRLPACVYCTACTCGSADYTAPPAGFPAPVLLLLPAVIRLLRLYPLRFHLPVTCTCCLPAVHRSATVCLGSWFLPFLPPSRSTAWTVLPAPARRYLLPAWITTVTCHLPPAPPLPAVLLPFLVFSFLPPVLPLPPGSCLLLEPPPFHAFGRWLFTVPAVLLHRFCTACHLRSGLRRWSAVLHLLRHLPFYCAFYRFLPPAPFPAAVFTCHACGSTAYRRTATTAAYLRLFHTVCRSCTVLYLPGYTCTWISPFLHTVCSAACHFGSFCTYVLVTGLRRWRAAPAPFCCLPAVPLLLPPATVSACRSLRSGRLFSCRFLPADFLRYSAYHRSHLPFCWIPGFCCSGSTCRSFWVTVFMRSLRSPFCTAYTRRFCFLFVVLPTYVLIFSPFSTCLCRCGFLTCLPPRFCSRRTAVQYRPHACCRVFSVYRWFTCVLCYLPYRTSSAPAGCACHHGSTVLPRPPTCYLRTTIYHLHRCTGLHLRFLRLPDTFSTTCLPTCLPACWILTCVRSPAYCLRFCFLPLDSPPVLYTWAVLPAALCRLPFVPLPTAPGWILFLRACVLWFYLHCCVLRSPAFHCVCLPRLPIFATAVFLLPAHRSFLDSTVTRTVPALCTAAPLLRTGIVLPRFYRSAWFTTPHLPPHCTCVPHRFCHLLHRFAFWIPFVRTAATTSPAAFVCISHHYVSPPAVLPFWHVFCTTVHTRSPPLCGLRTATPPFSVRYLPATCLDYLPFIFCCRSLCTVYLRYLPPFCVHLRFLPAFYCTLPAFTFSAFCLVLPAPAHRLTDALTCHWFLL